MGTTTRNENGGNTPNFWENICNCLKLQYLHYLAGLITMR